MTGRWNSSFLLYRRDGASAGWIISRFAEENLPLQEQIISAFILETGVYTRPNARYAAKTPHLKQSRHMDEEATRNAGDKVAKHGGGTYNVMHALQRRDFAPIRFL